MRHIHVRNYTHIPYIRVYVRMYIIDMRETNNCPRSRATMRNDLKFIGMYVNYFNYYTAVKG